MIPLRMTEFSHPIAPPILALAGGLALLLVSLSYAWARGRKGASVRILGTGLRLIALALLAVCLLDPQHVTRILHPHSIRLAVLFDESRSMATADVPGGRLAAARSWMEQKFTPQLAPGVELVPLAFSDRLRPLTNTPFPSSPTGALTGIAAALESIASGPVDESLSGILLFSDGIETAARAPETAARQLRRRGVPVHTVLTGTTNELRDVILEQVQVRRSIAQDSPTKVTLQVRSPGFAGSNALLQLRRGADVLATRPIRLAGSAQEVDLEFTPRGSGFQIFDAIVTPQSGEWLASNNQRRFGIEIIDPTLRVLYMEGTPQQQSSPQPEWKYLKDALQSDRRIKVKVLYRQFGNNGQYLNTIDSDPITGERAWPVEHPTEGFPTTLEGLLQYDVVIHSDIRRESFSPEQLDHIASLVEQHGGGFVMIGGNSAFGRGGYHQTVLDRIIPLAMEGAYDNEARQVRLRVASNAWTHPLIHFGANPEDTRRIWTARFPTLYGYNRVERAKPAATVLAHGDEDVILLAVQQAGRGRTMAFTSDTTRSWGRDFETLWGEPLRAGTYLNEDNCDSRYYRAFWVNAVRWLAAGKASRTNQPVQLELGQTYAAPGDPITLSVRVRDTAQREIPSASVALAILSGSSSNVVANAAWDANSRTYKATITTPPSGSHLITAIATLRGTRLGDDRQLLVSETVDREMLDLRARPEVMGAIARASGGSPLDVRSNPAPEIVRSIAQVPPPTVELKRTPLWDRWPWLATALGLLCAEWSLRRWRGLA